MSLSRKIAAALDELEGRDLPATAEVADGPHTLSLEVAAAAPVGLEAAGLTFRAPGPDRSLAELRAWGERVASRVTYLMEPLRVHEADEAGVEVALRSVQPTSRPGRRSFFEARLSREGTLRLGRYAVDEATGRRGPARFQLTRETLERLSDDLAATAR